MTENSKYVRFDWAIKRILRDKANKEVLEGLIQVLIKEPVTITEILESENNKDSLEDKGNRVDVKAKTEKGEHIVVEVQLTKESDFFQRIIFGTTTAINDQIGIGQDYHVIKKVYSINILYFNFGSGDDYAFHGVTTFRGMTNKDAELKLNTKSEREYMDSERRRMTSPEEVFPEYFLLIVDRFNEVAKTPIEEWMAYLKDGAIRDDTTTPGLQEARRKLEYMRMTDEERRDYREYMVSVHAAQDAIETAKADGRAEGWADGIEEGRAEGREVGRAEGREVGRAEGIEEGRAEGIEEGRAEGIEEGRAEGRELGRAEGIEEGRAEGRELGRAEGREVGRAEGREEANRDNAVKMKKKGIPDDIIADITGLPVNEIQQL